MLTDSRRIAASAPDTVESGSESSGENLPGEDPFAAPCWSQALDLTERFAALCPRAGEAPFDTVLAARRLERWSNQPPFPQSSLWQRRLATIGLGEAELLTLLGEPSEALYARTEDALPWLEELRDAYGETSATAAEPVPWPAAARQRLVFLPFVEPLVHRARARLSARVSKLRRGAPSTLIDEASVDALLAHLPEVLTPLINPTLVVELQVARLEERLDGETPEARFDAFLDQLRQPENACEILRRYPELARRLVERISQWEEAGAEFLEHLVTDADEIRRHFDAGDTLDRLVEARGAVSDPHRGGRGVFLLRFASGFRLVFKPRPLAVESAFQEFLVWLNGRGFEPAMRPVRILDQGTHGWMEWVEAEACPSAAEIQRFYQRQGGLLALFYLLDGSDFHHENLIAVGEHPVPVDLEMLFHPWIDSRSLRDLQRQPGASLRSNVMRSNLLPHRLWGNHQRAGVDLSGLGAQEGQLTPQDVLATAERGTDQMRIERRQVEIPISENRPRFDGAEVSLLDHADDLRAGFRRMYDLFAEHRAELAADDGPLTPFAGTVVRVLLRPTASYGALLLESYHPHFLGNALERQRFLDRLWSGVTQRPFLEPLIPSELRDLASGDIPHFTTRPDSRDLWTSSGERLRDFFEDSGLERVKRRLGALSLEDRARQEEVIAKALETVRLTSEDCPRPSYAFFERAEPAQRQELLDAARQVADRLVASAFQESEEALWLTVEHREPEGWRLSSTGPDLYQGLPGIAFFLGYLGELTGEDTYTDVARRAATILTHQAEETPSPLEGLGAFSGWGGLIYVFTHLAQLWNEEVWLDHASSYAERVAPQIESDENLDLIAGSAGYLIALLQLESQRPSELLRRTAQACGEHLLARAEPQAAGGLGWPIPLAGSRALAGISHGASGIALGLFQLAAACDDERFRRAAVAGIEFERGLYDATERNWPDLRVGATKGLHGGEHFMCAWCHGAPGIGLARIAALPLLEDRLAREEIRLAVATTLDRGFGHNHCLCHGDLGNLCFLLDAARVLDDTTLASRVERLAGGVMDGIEENGWLFGMPGSLQTPGLMVGLAGIGYGLAYLAAPDRLPSILRLATPLPRNTLRDHPTAFGGGSLRGRRSAAYGALLESDP